MTNYLGFLCGWSTERTAKMGMKKFGSYVVMDLTSIEKSTSGYFSSYTDFSKGDRVVFYDESTQPRELTDGEIQLRRYKLPVAPPKSSSTSSSVTRASTYTYKKKTEKGLQIKTKKERDKEESKVAATTSSLVIMDGSDILDVD